MGQLMTKLHNRRRKVLVLGRKAGGKTTILRMLENRHNNTMYDLHKCNPTKGFEMKTVLGVNFWDLSGNPAMKFFWRCYYSDVDGVIYVVDCNDQKFYDGCVEDVSGMLESIELRNSVFLVVFNMKDNACFEITKKVKDSLFELCRFRDVDYCECVSWNISEVSEKVDEFFQKIRS